MMDATGQQQKSESGGLAELPLKPEYRSDVDDLIQDFYVPCLIRSVAYHRAVGYFTSRGLAAAAQGITALINGDGRMQLIASPFFDLEDLEAIARGYAARESVVTESLVRQLQRSPDATIDNRLGYLAWLVAEGRLEIRIALPVDKNGILMHGIYHEKIGIFVDPHNGAVAFTGSPNETVGGLVDNFESLDVFCSWDDPHDRVKRKFSNFDRLWKDRTSGLAVLDFPEAAKQQLLKHRPTTRPDFENQKRAKVREHQVVYPSRRWRHQDDAITEFLKKERGVLEMATGTGKTKTAIRIGGKLVREGAIDTIIVSADGTDLLDQWHIQLLELTSRLAEPFAIFRHYLTYHERDRFVLDPKHTILLISRPALAPALRSLTSAQGARALLVHDEVHRLGSPGNRESLRGLSDDIRFRLGLSATPEREYDQDGNTFIEQHIGPVIFRFGLEDAIRRGILSPFTYFRLEYIPDADDSSRLQQVFKKSAARAQAGDPMSQEEVWTELAKVYKTSRAKLPIFEAFIRDHKDLLERCIIFVETRDYGDAVLNIVHKFRHDFHTYFADEDSSTLQRFARGDIECLLTCHRLSEGIDIRSLKTVILFSSARAKLETIQRMGRCLRSDPIDPEKRANVVDFIRVSNVVQSAPDDNTDQERRAWLEQLAGVGFEQEAS